MFERFTERAQNAITLASEEAVSLNHEYVGTEHVLLGVIKAGGSAADVLNALDVDLDRTLREIEKLIRGDHKSATGGRLPWTPRASKIIEYAKEESQRYKHGPVNTAHLLLGLLREDFGVAAQILLNFGISLEGLQVVIDKTLRQPLSWGQEPPWPSFPKEIALQSGKSSSEMPKACPKCGRPVVRVIWGWVRLFGTSLEDVTAGRAILASPVDKGRPLWVCLQCSPRWSDVHQLALRKHELQVEKENAIISLDLDKAAKCRNEQTNVRRELIILLDKLSRPQ